MVGAEPGHDRVVVALEEQCRRTQLKRSWVIGLQDFQQWAEIGARAEHFGGHQRWWRARGKEVVDAAGLGFGQVVVTDAEKALGGSYNACFDAFGWMFASRLRLYSPEMRERTDDYVPYRDL